MQKPFTKTDTLVGDEKKGGNALTVYPINIFRSEIYGKLYHL